MTEREIIDREIRGITARTVAWFMGSVLGLMIMIFGTYISIIRKIDSLSAIQSDINRTNIRIDGNTIDIKDMKQHMFPAMDTRISVIEEQYREIRQNLNNQK